MRGSWFRGVLLGLGILAAARCGAQEDGARLASDYEPVVRETMESWGIPGVAVAVVRGTEPVYLKGFGVRSLDTGEAVTEDSLFHCASVTKTFVATAVMQLVDGGRIDLDAPVSAYLPYFTLKEEASRAVPIRQFLNHTAGMPDVLNYEWNKPTFGEDALETYIRGLARRKLRSTPGTKHAYSNIGYEVLGDVIAKASGMTFEDYVTAHILQPAGMRTSTLMYPHADKALLTAPHLGKGKNVHQGEVFPYNRRHAPSSTLLSSARELARWAVIHLNHGEIEGTRILPAALCDEMQAPLDPKFDSRGTGWAIGEYKGRKTVSHGGSDKGFRCFFLLVPEERLGLAVLTNLDGAPAYDLVTAALEVLLPDAL